MTRKEMKIMKYVKFLVLLATLSALPKIVLADVTLVNDPYGACCYLKNCEYWVCEEMYQSECSTLFDGTHWANKTCDDIDCPNFSVFDLGACCVEDADGGMICYFVKETDCESYGGVWHPGIPCECEPCTPATNDCIITPSTNCVGRPQYTHPDYVAFGNGHIAIETASTSILGGSTVMLFDLSGTLPLDTAFPLNRYNHPSWEHPNSDPAPDMGSIFGLAVDEVGNIYVSATKTWGNPDIEGTYGWGAVYKIDTNTALPELFASIPMPNNESSLGTITYDCDHSQFSFRVLKMASFTVLICLEIFLTPTIMGHRMREHQDPLHLVTGLGLLKYTAIDSTTVCGMRMKMMFQQQWTTKYGPSPSMEQEVL